MFSKLFTAVLVASSVLVGNCASAAKPKNSKTISPFTAQLVEYRTTLPYATVIERLDVQVNKTGSLTFVTKFHNAKTKAEQTTLIADIVQDRNFLFFYENDHRAWLDVYDPETPHLSGTVYTLGNPNFASQIIPLEYTTSVNIPPRFLILEQADHTGTRIVYQQPSSVFAPFNKRNPELQTHVKALDTNFAALFEGIIAY